MKKTAFVVLAAFFLMLMPIRSEELAGPRGKRVWEPLPAGAVKPAGWLKDWEITARNGYTAVMDDVDPEFKNAWTSDFAPTCPVGDWVHGSWSFEGGGYWFEGLVRMAYQLDDPELFDLVQKKLGPVLENHTRRGIGNFYWFDRTKKEDLEAACNCGGWGIWANGLYTRAMTEYYLASKDERALGAVTDSLDSHDINALTIAGGGVPNTTWSACIDYIHSHDSGVAECLTRFFDHQDVDWHPCCDIFQKKPNLPELKPQMAERPFYFVERMHGVVLNEIIAGWGAGTYWTGRPEFLETALAWQDLVDEIALQPYGAIVEDELTGPMGAYRSTETCALAAEMWRRIMFATMTGCGGDADKIERLFFNAGANCTTRDFTGHVYFQQPNRIETGAFIYTWGNPTNCTFQRKHYPLCCTAGVNRIIPMFIQHLWMKTTDHGLAAVMYAPNETTASVADSQVTVKTETAYPFEETLQMTIATEKEVAFPLYLRIPNWCENPLVTLNGESVPVEKNEKGFMCINRTWNKETALTLTFPMKAKLEERIDRNVKQVAMPEGGAWGKAPALGMYSNDELGAVPCADVSYGPLLFVYPIPEQDENSAVAGERWQYALSPEKTLENVEIIRSELVRPWGWSVDSPVKIRVNAVEADWTHDSVYPHIPTAEEMTVGKPCSITLVPYGCSKLRVSLFPVINQ